MKENSAVWPAAYDTCERCGEPYVPASVSLGLCVTCEQVEEAERAQSEHKRELEKYQKS